MNRLITLALIGLTATLTGCFEVRKNTDQLCKDTPELRCERLNMDDGQCRVPRTDLIWHRFEVFKDPTDQNLIKEYNLLSEYKKCLELASQIQPIDQSNLKQRRFEALVNSGKDLEALVKKLSESTSPQALYFLWSRTGSDSARRAFLQMEGSPQLESAEMQYALATFYTGRDQEKTIALLKHALELTKSSPVNVEILKSLASIHYQTHQREQAYVWAMVAKAFDVPIASEKELQLLYGFDKDKYRQLDAFADDIEDAIRAGKFQRQQLEGLD